MIFQRIKSSDPEKVFVVVKNSYSTASLSNGQVVQWDFLSEKDGVSVSIPSGMATNLGQACAGIVAETIAFGSYGLVQCYGYHSAVRARANTTDDAVTLGEPIRMPLAAGAFCAEAAEISGTLVYKPIGFALAATAGWTTTTIAAFIKAM